MSTKWINSSRAFENDFASLFKTPFLCDFIISYEAWIQLTTEYSFDTKYIILLMSLSI